MTRAIWKGALVLGDEQVPVRLYSAVQDRKVHFHLLHKKDMTPVHQRIVRKTDGKEVPREERRKAFPLDRGKAVILQPEELEGLEPEDSREIHLTRFVPPSALNEQWYDRPYYLGPDEDVEGYFALAQALGKEDLVGIARWVMRDRGYVGALRTSGGYLMMITLRRADQVIAVSNVAIDKASQADPKEIRLAQTLVESIEGDFDPDLWEDDYHKRVCKLIEAKQRGEKIKVEAPRPRRSSANLADLLQQSLGAKREKKVA